MNIGERSSYRICESDTRTDNLLVLVLVVCSLLIWTQESAETIGQFLGATNISPSLCRNITGSNETRRIQQSTYAFGGI